VGVGGSGFCCVGGHLLANAVTERVDLKVGQISPKDIQAPQRVINRYQTDRLRAAEADRAVTQAVQDPANYIIDQTAAVEAREQIATVFATLIEAIPADLQAPGEGGGEEAPAAWRPDDRLVQQVAAQLRNGARLEVPTVFVAEALEMGGGAPCRA